MASAASNQTITTTEIEIFNAADDGGDASEFQIYVGSGSSNALLVHIDSLHVAGEYFGIAPGRAVNGTGPARVRGPGLEPSPGQASIGSLGR